MEQTQPSNAILTVPNLLTFLRLGLTPLFLWLALGPDEIGWAMVVAVSGIATDLIDGPIARRTGRVSKLGIALDPLADRLGIASAAVVLIVHDLSPLWLVLAVVVRDALLVGVGVPLLKARGIPLPAVTLVGKRGSFATSLGFGSLLASGIWSVDDPNRAFQIAGYVLLAIGLPLYWIAGAGYIRAGLAGLRGRGAGTRE